MTYEILKAVHLLAVISWMAGLLYLPRLFVYHAQTPIGSVQAETFKVMERRLLKAIMNPAMIVTFLVGGIMLWMQPSLFLETWMQVKIVAVLAMGACHGKFSKMRRLIENDAPLLSDKAYRVWNEVPTVLMIIIVVMVVVKPF